MYSGHNHISHPPLKSLKHMAFNIHNLYRILLLTDAELQQILNPPKGVRKRPMCKKCGKARKGHKKGQCSDRNAS